MRTFAAIAKICAVLVLVSAVAAGDESKTDAPVSFTALQITLRSGKQALREGDGAAALRAFRSVAAVLPEDPGVLLDLARAEVLSGETDQALDTLQRVVGYGFGIEIGADPAFARLAALPRFTALSHQVELLTAPVTNSKVAFTVAERDLIPEGMAYDARTRTFYLSSLYKRKIVAVDRTGKARNFIAAGQDGIWKVLGMKVDQRRRTLVVCSMAGDGEVQGGLPAADRGRAGVWIFDLATGHTRAKFVTPPDSRRHLFNDLVVTRRGDIYVTDSEEGSVYKIGSNPGLQRLTAPGRFLYPNGIAISPDERMLYVADAAGINLIDLPSSTISPLPHPADVSLVGIDGLYLHRGSLIAVQNDVTPMRIMQFRLDEHLKRVTSAQVLERRSPQMSLPTTGAIVGEDFYFIANSQVNAFDADGQLWPLEKLHPVIVLRTPIPNSRP